MRDSIGGVGVGGVFGLGAPQNTGVGVGQTGGANNSGFAQNLNPPSAIKEGDGGGQQFFGGASAGPKSLEEDAQNSLLLIQDSLINLSFSEQVRELLSRGDNKYY